MDKWSGKVAIVTGASAGIGAVIASTLVHHGMVVVGLARRKDRIQQLAEKLFKSGEPGTLHAVNADLRKEEDILEAFAWVEKELGGADVLVNNAGVYFTSYFIEGKTEDWRAMFDINVLAVAICTREFLKSMEKRNNKIGHIFIISSIAAYTTEYVMTSMYCSSKHALMSLCSSVRRELAEKKSTIKLTSISPGPVATEIFIETTHSDILRKMAVLESEDVATVVVDSLSASSVSQICDVTMNPVPTTYGLY